MQREFQPTVYILASRKNGTLYTGVTSDLIERDNLGWHDLAEDLGFAPLEPTGSPLSRG